MITNSTHRRWNNTIVNIKITSHSTTAALQNSTTTKIAKADLQKGSQKLKLLGPVFYFIERSGLGKAYLLSVPVEFERYDENLVVVAQNDVEDTVTFDEGEWVTYICGRNNQMLQE